MAVRALLGDRATKVPGGDTAREDHHAVLILDHRRPFCPRNGYLQGMKADPRAALANLTAAFERHLEASASRRGENDPTVVAAYQAVADAFDHGDDGDDGDDDEVLDDHSDEDGDSTGVYLGLDDSDYDEEPSRTL